MSLSCSLSEACHKVGRRSSWWFADRLADLRYLIAANHQATVIYNPFPLHYPPLPSILLAYLPTISSLPFFFLSLSVFLSFIFLLVLSFSFLLSPLRSLWLLNHSFPSFFLFFCLFPLSIISFSISHLYSPLLSVFLLPRSL